MVQLETKYHRITWEINKREEAREVNALIAGNQVEIEEMPAVYEKEEKKEKEGKQASARSRTSQASWVCLECARVTVPAGQTGPLMGLIFQPTNCNQNNN